MAVEGLVTAVRTEQVGRRPARTVYAITDQGRMELASLRERAINGHALRRRTRSGWRWPSRATGGDDIGELTRLAEHPAGLPGGGARRAAHVAEREERLVSKGHIGPLQAADDAPGRADAYARS